MIFTGKIVVFSDSIALKKKKHSGESKKTTQELVLQRHKVLNFEQNTFTPLVMSENERMGGES